VAVLRAGGRWPVARTRHASSSSRKPDAGAHNTRRPPLTPLLPPAQTAPAAAHPRQDPKAKKPEDWEENEMMADPEDKKPAGYDDIPATLPDPDAKKPEDWDDEDDGEWEAPTIPNPEYKGEWKPKM